MQDPRNPPMSDYRRALQQAVKWHLDQSADASNAAARMVGFQRTDISLLPPEYLGLLAQAEWHRKAAAAIGRLPDPTAEAAKGSG